MPSVREDIVKLTQEADRLTEYYVQRIKKYGVAATRTEVAKGEARIAEIGKMVRDLEAKEQANYGFKGQGWKQRMESLKSADTRIDDAMARIQRETREIDDTLSRCGGLRTQKSSSSRATRSAHTKA